MVAVAPPSGLSVLTSFVYFHAWESRFRKKRKNVGKYKRVLPARPLIKTSGVTVFIQSFSQCAENVKFMCKTNAKSNI